jgi:hypothetical protein
MAEQDGGKTTTKKAAAPAPATEAPKAEAEKAAPADPRYPLGRAPELGTKGKALVAAALRANGGEFPQVEYPVKEAFGQTYPKGMWTSHKVEWVQKLVWDLRQLRTQDGGEAPSYRSIAEALGIQCSAITEAVTHSFGRKAKVTDDTWKVNTGGRVDYLKRQGDAPAKPSKTG